MTDKNSIIDFGDLSKPATVLIEKISQAAGILYEPTHIRRTAKAQSEAAIVIAKGEIKVTDLHRRALTRFVEEEAKNQSNIESITAEAIPLLDSDVDPTSMDNDWIRNFFDKCKLISDIDMQSLWARVLAGEANSNNSFSKRTINFMSSMDKNEAIAFQKICAFCVTLTNTNDITETFPVIHNIHDKIYIDNGLSFDLIAILENIGLISTCFRSTATYGKGDVSDGEIKIHYHGVNFHCWMPKSKKGDLNIGKVLFSNTGKELQKICEPSQIPDFPEYMEMQMKLLGYSKPENPS